MQKLFAALVGVAAVALAVPSTGAAATLAADPAKPCYREQDTVFLPGSGFTGNARVDFFRDGVALQPDPPIVADASGAILGRLVLPGLRRGQRRFTYSAVDSANPANTAEVGLLVTATDVVLNPRGGALTRPVTVTARGFFGGRRLWAHVVRRGARRSSARNVKLGRIKGPCRKSKRKRRLFRAGMPSGQYRVQFDTFRRYKPRRRIEAAYGVTIS